SSASVRLAAEPPPARLSAKSKSAFYDAIPRSWRRVYGSATVSAIMTLEERSRIFSAESASELRSVLVRGKSPLITASNSADYPDMKPRGDCPSINRIENPAHHGNYRC